jgi:hypothetical protein
MRRIKKQKNQPEEKGSLMSGVFLAYTILLLHVALLAGLGCVVLFFRGITEYMMWIFIAGTALVSYSGYRVYKRMKMEQSGLRDMMNMPMFRGRNLEISFLGGMASVKIQGQQGGMETIELQPPLAPQQIEDPAVHRVRELTELARLLENNLITPDEFQKTKDHLLNGIGKS